jgi:DNA-binding winged helix-turn-helix (wHTH) protein
VLNLETYQAAVAGRSSTSPTWSTSCCGSWPPTPGKVFTRETLLSRVWGYEYYGGARTVDVHVRRLRAKLGEEHAHLIQTVRSVGYRDQADLTRAHRPRSPARTARGCRDRPERASRSSSY